MTAPTDTATRTVRLAAARRTRRRLRPERALLGFAGILTFLLVWEVAARTGLVNPVYLPPPTVVLPTLVEIMTLTGFWYAVGQTVISWGFG